MSLFHSLSISHVARDTRDAVVLTFAIPPALQALYAFQQGQYVTLRARIEGTDVRRAYSICSEEGGALRVGIKHALGGIMSGYANTHLKAGDAMEVMTPEGKFGQLKQLATRSQTAPRYLGIASGSGITPILSIIKTTLTSNAQSSFTLIYGNRATSSVMFKEALALLKDRYPTRLNLIYVMSREPQDMDIFHGRIDRAKCDALFEKWLDVSLFEAAFVCGPESMMREAKAALEANGMEHVRIKTELFAAQTPTTTRKLKPAPRDAANQCEVTLVMDGTTRHFNAIKGSQSLLDAGLQAGLDMRFSCKGGVCSTCRAKVTQGEVEMDVNYALEDYEVRRGFVLTCQSYCMTDKLTINFDEET